MSDYTGGLITQSGFAKIHQGELLLDNQAAADFLKAAQLLTGSQVLEQSRMVGVELQLSSTIIM